MSYYEAQNNIKHTRGSGSDTKIQSLNFVSDHRYLKSYPRHDVRDCLQRVFSITSLSVAISPHKYNVVAFIGS